MFVRMLKSCCLPPLTGVLPACLMMLYDRFDLGHGLGESLGMGTVLLLWVGGVTLGGLFAGYVTGRWTCGKWFCVLQIILATPELYILAGLYAMPREDWPTPEALMMYLVLAVVSLGCAVGGFFAGRVHAATLRHRVEHKVGGEYV